MQAIFDFLDGFTALLESIGAFISHIISELVYVFRITDKATEVIDSFFSWLPNNVSAMIVLILGIAIVYKVVGREG